MVVLIESVLLLVAAVWGQVRHHPWWMELRPGPRLVVGLLLGVVLALVSRFLFKSLDRAGLFDYAWFCDDLLRPIFAKGAWWTWLGISILSGVAEEALFRGVVAWETGVLASSLLFGLLHTGDRRLIAVGVWAFLVGAALAAYYLTTRDLLSCMVVHATVNFVSLMTVSLELA